MNYVFFESVGLPDIKVNDFIKVKDQHWLVNMIVNPGLDNCSLQCFRNGEKKTFTIQEVENVVPYDGI